MQKLLFYIIIFLYNVNLFAQSELNIAVLDFDAKGISKAEASILSDELRYNLVNLVLCTIIERNKMDEILGEQGFQLSGCTSDECVVEAGKILNVKKVIAGSVGKIGSTYILNTRLIDIETSKIEKVVNKKHKGDIEGLLLLMNGLSVELLTKTGNIFITTDPIGTQISINDNEPQKSPFTFENLKVGQIKVSLSLNNWKNEIIDVEIKKDTQTNLYVPLKKLKFNGLNSSDIGQDYKKLIDYRSVPGYYDYEKKNKLSGKNYTYSIVNGLGFMLVGLGGLLGDLPMPKYASGLMTVGGGGILYYIFKRGANFAEKIKEFEAEAEKINQKNRAYNRETHILLEKEEKRRQEEFNKKRDIEISYEKIRF